MNIRGMQRECHKTALAKGWWDVPRTPLEIHALITSEVGEATQEVRDGKPPFYHGKGNKPEGEAVELADVIIRIMDYAEQQKWDMEEIILLKMAYNKTRPYRHGNKKA